MDQGGVRTVGLKEDQLDELSRKIIEEDGELQCAICQEAYKKGEETIVLACAHQFHADCICPWLIKVASCPICRHDPLKKEEVPSEPHDASERP